jgi:tetratricopeptide (TPR) repeat protein
MANEQHNNDRAAQRAALKKMLFEQSNVNDTQDDFLKEAQEGWQALGSKKYDAIHQQLENRIDAATAPAKKEAKVVSLNANFFRVMTIAATVLVAVVSIWMFNSKQNSPEQLFAGYYKPLHDSNVSVVRGEEDKVEPNAFKAAQAYEAEEFDQAIFYYKELLKSQPGNAKYTLFLGLAYMSSGKSDAAINLYNDFKPSGDKYDEDIQWYLALAYLQKGEVRTAKVLIKDLTQSKGYYASTAGELLKKMN